MVQEPEILHEKTKNKRFPRPIHIGLLVGLVVFALTLGIGLLRPKQTQPIVGDIAPSFSLRTYDGMDYGSEDLRGQIVIVNFWANWCAPCHAEAPALEQIYQEFRDKGVLLLGMNWQDSESDAFSFIQRYEISYPNAPDTDERIYDAFRVQGMPQTFVIGKDGRIARIYLGAISYDDLSAFLSELLAEGA